MFKTEGG